MIREPVIMPVPEEPKVVIVNMVIHPDPNIVTSSVPKKEGQKKKRIGEDDE